MMVGVGEGGGEEEAKARKGGREGKMEVEGEL